MSHDKLTATVYTYITATNASKNYIIFLNLITWSWYYKQSPYARTLADKTTS